MAEQELSEEELNAILASQLNAPGFDQMESVVQINALDGSLDNVLIPPDILNQYTQLREEGINAVIFLTFRSNKQVSFQVSILPDDSMS